MRDHHRVRSDTSSWQNTSPTPVHAHDDHDSHEVRGENQGYGLFSRSVDNEDAPVMDGFSDTLWRARISQEIDSWLSSSSVDIDAFR